jgi:hypothetical protein
MISTSMEKYIKHMLRTERERMVPDIWLTCDSKIYMSVLGLPFPSRHMVDL